MSRLRKLAGFVLVLVLTASWASAAPLRPASPEPRYTAVFAAAETLFQRLWGWLSGTSAKEGCDIDPSGHCAVPDEGCGIDPSGSCAAPTFVKEGCIIDPSGRCITYIPPTAQGVAGCGIDPSGSLVWEAGRAK